MKLKEYIMKYEKNLNDFSKRIPGVSQPTIWRVANGQVVPTLENAVAISNATNGKVDITDLIIHN